MFTGLIKQVHKVKFLVNDNSSTILTGMGVSGTVVTAYLSGRAGFKAARLISEETQTIEILDEDEGTYVRVKDTSLSHKIKLTWRLYIPPFAAGVTTITCIVVANKISSKKIAALTVASGISERALQEYKEKVVEKLGERENIKIHDAIAQKRVDENPVSSREVILAGTGEVLCFDMLTGRYFQSTVEEIKRAENKINHELIHFMRASLSEFYEEIGLPPTPFSDTVGWSTDHVEVRFSTTMSSDNRPCIAIDFVSPPHSNYDRNVYS